MGAVVPFPSRPAAMLRAAVDIIWLPEAHSLAVVAAAAVAVYESPDASYSDARQAAYLIATMRALSQPV